MLLCVAGRMPRNSIVGLYVYHPWRSSLQPVYPDPNDPKDPHGHCCSRRIYLDPQAAGKGSKEEVKKGKSHSIHLEACAEDDVDNQRPAPFTVDTLRYLYKCFASDVWQEWWSFLESEWFLQSGGRNQCLARVE